MEEHAILSEKLEDQLKVVEWARAEQKRILKEKGDRLTKSLAETMIPFILSQHQELNDDALQTVDKENNI